MVTDENLKDAFAGESQANRRYVAFARRAEQENLPQIARLFRAAAQAETVHALNHFQAMRCPQHQGELAGSPCPRELRIRTDVPTLHRGSDGRRGQAGHAIIQQCDGG